jgi:hypothetical protein
VARGADAGLAELLDRPPSGDRYSHGAQACWRQPIEFDYFVRIERYPFMAAVVRDPRYAALMKSVKEDLGRMRARLRARDGPDTSTRA